MDCLQYCYNLSDNEFLEPCVRDWNGILLGGPTDQKIQWKARFWPSAAQAKKRPKNLYLIYYFFCGHAPKVCFLTTWQWSLVQLHLELA